MNHQHHYRVAVEWTGNLGSGTDGYRNYSRDHVIRIDGKLAIAGSSDPTFRGDAAKHNPEDMLVTALSEGMRTLKQDGIAKIFAGISDYTQLLHVTAE